MSLAPPKFKTIARQPAGIAKGPVDDLERRRELGQFFTSPQVAGFVWDLLEVIHGGSFPAKTRVIDPACGEGVFLRAAHERGRLPAKGLFGADIDASLVPGWQKDSLLRETSLRLANGLFDDQTGGVAEGAFDIVVGNPPFSGKGLRDLLRVLEDPLEGTRPEHQDLFTTSYLPQTAVKSGSAFSIQERVELEKAVRVLSRYSCWRLEPEPDAIDELEPSLPGTPTELFAADVLCDRRRPTVGDYDRAAELISQWPLNRPLDTSRLEVRDVVRRIASTAIEVVFAERFLRLAKPGGLIGIIVPESIVASDRLGQLRIWLLGRMDLLATVGLPQKAFTGVGANAKTTIVFARRRIQERPKAWLSPEAPNNLPGDDAPIFMTAPRLDAPEWSLENYLARVLADARRDHERFWPAPK